MTAPDRVLTIAIGRLDRDGAVLPTSRWHSAMIQLFNTAQDYGTVVFRGYGAGVTSNQDEEESFVLIVLMPGVGAAVVSDLKYRVSNLLASYHLSSACFAIDYAHAPAWASDLKTTTSETS